VGLGVYFWVGMGGVGGEGGDGVKVLWRWSSGVAGHKRLIACVVIGFEVWWFLLGGVVCLCGEGGEMFLFVVLG